MTPFVRHAGVAAALPIASIDTDQLIPARFMSRPRAEGYGGFLLHDLRRTADGGLDPAFPLNRAPGDQAAIIVARRNFGSGSSREAAVYALVDAGIRVVIAPTFGDIFASNAVKNGLLPARLDDDAVEALLARLAEKPDAPVAVDLAAGTVVWPGGSASITIDPVWREQLLNGWDDVDVTRSFAADIAAFAARDAAERPWARPRAPLPAGADRPQSSDAV